MTSTLKEDNVRNIVVKASLIKIVEIIVKE